ncbi:MAG: response regulator transcription factor [Chloroflexota bacterium]|nr:response regulator transcription factor [Chloroflexota bacterium]
MTDTGPQILIVDDDDAAREAIAANLVGHGFNVRQVASGEQAMREWEGGRPDLVLLDIGLPGMSGLDVIRRLRRDATTPIVIISVRGAEPDKVAALDLGADDYLTKPFGMAELHARIRATLRRTLGEVADPAGVVEIGSLRLDPAQRQVTIRGEQLHLTPREYELLKVMLSHAGRLVTGGRLLRAVWGTAYAEEGHYLHVYVAQIRRKIANLDPEGELADLLFAEPGIGYRVRAAVASS